MDIQKLKEKKDRFVELEKMLADPAVMEDQNEYQKLAKEYSDLTPIVQTFDEYMEVVDHLNQNQQIISDDNSDPELKELAEMEVPDLESEKESFEEKLNELLHPKKAESNRDLIFEIRAGTGGEEASLFAADLFRMYSKYADKNSWKIEVISSHESETGGFKEIIFSISGVGAEKHLQWESGGHRVQRVPATEASGRIHTSAATVAVMKEAEEVEVEIKPEEVRVDIFRSSGPGGQSVNTTDSAVRLTHLPTGIVVSCQDERSQLKNKAKAMRVLRTRVYDKIIQEQMAQESQTRKLQVGSGDRSEKIRTYNYPDRRVTDHRIGLTLYKLDQIMDGNLDELTEGLIKADQEETLET